MSLIKNKSITILINNLKSGGAEKVCVVLCNEFIKRGYNIELWVAQKEETYLSSQLNDSVNVIYLNKNKVRYCILPLIKLLIKKKPKVILGFNTELTILLILLKRILFQKPRIIMRNISTLSIEMNKPINFWGKFIKHPIIKGLLDSADAIIAQSSGMKLDLVKNYKIDTEKIEIINNPAIVLNDRCQIKQLITRKNEIVFIGRLAKPKGLTYLFEAMTIAIKTIPDLHLTMVGEGEDKDSLMCLAEDLQLSSNIDFIGFKKDISPYIIKAKATVLTSIREGFPNALVESIALGTPVIAFNCQSGPKDIITPDVNGILVPFLDVDAFSNAIISVMEGKVVFDQEKVKQSAERFNLDTIVNLYEKVIWQN